MTPKLSDLQLVLLSTAAARNSFCLLPLPDSLAGQRARVARTMPALLKRELVAETEVTDPSQIWREEGNSRIGLFITPAGRAAIGIAEPNADGVEAVAPELVQAPTAEPVVAASPRPTKASQVLALLRRAEGATLAELVSATGWLPHTTRAALTGLRKKGHKLAKGKRAEVTCYHLGETA